MSYEDARVAGFQRGGTAANTFQFMRTNSEQEQIVAQGLPPYTEMTRRGLGWQGMTTAALAALVVRPSTLGNLTLWNGEVGPTAKSYVVDRVFAFNLVSTAAQARHGIWLCSHPAGMAAPTADITAIKSTNGKSAYTGLARLDTAATVVDDGWFPWGTGFTKGAGGVLPMGVISVNVEGRLIVPPQCSLCLHTVASLVGDTTTMGASWFEEQLSIE